MNCDKDTIICGSFSSNPSNFGAKVHNLAAKYYNLNFIYKPFAVDNIKQAIEAMRTLKFRGIGISMPFKVSVLEYVDAVSEEVKHIGSANTIINDGKLTAYNTDYLSTFTLLNEQDNRNLVILGNGGYAKAVIYSANILDMSYSIITRNTWNNIKDIKNSVIFNCTPVKNITTDSSNVYIDSQIDTLTGKRLSFIQANEQFYLYTGHPFPWGFDEYLLL